jgi:hypothetical protein
MVIYFFRRTLIKVATTETKLHHANVNISIGTDRVGQICFSLHLVIIECNALPTYIAEMGETKILDRNLVGK